MMGEKMSERGYEEFFDELADKPEGHERIAMRNKWGPNASYTIAERYLVGSVLDVGCGSGAFGERCSILGRGIRQMIGVDISEKQLANAAPFYEEVKKASASELPFQDNSFETVVALGVIQNCGIPPELLIEELCRVAEERVFITGLSIKKATQDPMETYHDPNHILSIFSKVMGTGFATWGAIRYEEGEVWTESWEKEDNGTFFICAALSEWNI